MTTYTVDGVGGGGNFASINAACTDIEANHDYSSDGKAEIVVTHSGQDTTPVTVGAASAGTPSSTNYIEIYADSSNRHAGSYNTSKARLENTSGSSNCMEIDEEYVHVHHMQFDQASTASSAECIRVLTNGDNTVIEKCIMRFSNGGHDQDGVYLGNYGVAPVTVFDCVITMDADSRAGIHAQNHSGTGTQTLHIEHCLIDGNGTNASDEACIQPRADDSGSVVNMNVYNTIAFGAVTNAAAFDEDPSGGDNGTINWSGQGNFSDDTSCTAHLGTTNNTNSATISVTDATTTEILVTSLTAGSEDYQLLDGTNSTDDAIDAAIDGGTRDSRLDLTTDIAGNSRPGTYTDRDCGPFEVASAESAALTGTIYAGGVLESEIVTGGETAIITLTGDTWVTAGATFDAQRQNIIDGFDAATSPTNGWNNEVRDKAAVTECVRTSDTVVTVTWAAQSGYSISADETITITIPASALTTRATDLEVTEQFVVTNETSGVPGGLSLLGVGV